MLIVYQNDYAHRPKLPKLKKQYIHQSTLSQNLNYFNTSKYFALNDLWGNLFLVSKYPSK
jgi:hypothetical protein